VMINMNINLCLLWH